MKNERFVIEETEFFGYSGDEPTLEFQIPNQGKIVFGKVTVEKGMGIIEKYLSNPDILKEVMFDNDGTKKSCNHH